MAIAGVGAFWAVSFLLVLVPGADWAYAIAAGLRHRTIAPAIGGLLAGYLILTAVVAAGLAALTARSPRALSTLTACGAAYLVWLGVTTIARPSPPDAASQDPGDGAWLARAAKGAGISGINPKALLLFLALLPQFALPGAGWPFAVQTAVLGLVHVLNCAVVYTSVGAAARRILRTRPTATITVTRCSGAAMIVIGVLLLGERLLT